MTGLRYTIEHHARGLPIPRDRPVWYDCPMLDTPPTMARAIMGMPKSVVAVTLVCGRHREQVAFAAVMLLDRDIEVVKYDPDTGLRDRTPEGF